MTVWRLRQQHCDNPKIMTNTSAIWEKDVTLWSRIMKDEYKQTRRTS